MHVRVRALRSFQYGNIVRSRRSDPFFVSRIEFSQLKSRGLVVETKDDPTAAVGIPSSALPAVPALPQTIASESDSGVKRRRRKRAESSLLTPASE